MEVSEEDFKPKRLTLEIIAPNEGVLGSRIERAFASVARGGAFDFGKGWNWRVETISPEDYEVEQETLA